DAAILITLSPGAYTVFLQGKAMATAIGLAEVYDVDPSANAQPTNLSGPRICWDRQRRVDSRYHHRRQCDNFVTCSRACAWSVACERGVATPLADPTLSLRDANGNVIANNDNWKDSQQADIAATGKAPLNDHESAILALLGPGNYTAIVAGKNGTTGVALVEFYSLP